jgi:hypothetical protein
MPSVSIKGQILEAFANRLTLITTANGYQTNVRKVYSDKIPMGIQLSKQQLPAIFLLEGPDAIELEHGCLKGNWDLRLQLWHNEVGDVSMIEFARDALKVIYANSAMAQRVDAFRALHSSITEVIPLSISPDLNMIEANRVTELAFTVRYRTKLYDL